MLILSHHFPIQNGTTGAHQSPSSGRGDGAEKWSLEENAQRQRRQRRRQQQQQPQQQQQQIYERPTERQWTQNQSSQKTLFRMELKDRPSDSGAKSALKRVIDACGTFRRTET
jgi:hypothetical protein